MATTPPTLGYGQRGEAPIDAFNQWFRAQPQYAAKLAEYGQRPNNVHLNDAQKQGMVRLAQSLGAVVDEGHDGQEVDDSGNFQAKSHTLRNTLIVAGIAGAALLTAGAAGAFAPAAAGAAELGPATAANMAATSAIVGGAGVPAGLAAGGGSAAVAGLSYADLLKYGLPVAGNLVGGLIQAKASGDATDAEQKYLEEALAYQKESDLFNRNRQAGLDAQEVQRYGDYQGRILPWIQNGTSSNDRMAALLGLPPRAGGSSGSSGPPASQRVPTDPATQGAIRAELQRVNSSDDPAAWDEYLASHGDSADKNWPYWKTRIDTGDGVGKGYAAAPAAPVSPAAAGVTITSQPLARSAEPVQMRAPDGSVKAVPADQVDHYKSLGATLLGAAA